MQFQSQSSGNLQQQIPVGTDPSNSPNRSSSRNRSRSSFWDRRPPEVPLAEVAREQEQSGPQEQLIENTANQLFRSIRPRLAPLVSGDLRVVRPHSPADDKESSAHVSSLLQPRL